MAFLSTCSGCWQHEGHHNQMAVPGWDVPVRLNPFPTVPFSLVGGQGWHCTLEASVRMSFESFTRHCRGTVTSITFTFSLFLLLSLTNFPYQAFTMMSPEDRHVSAGTGLLWTLPLGSLRLLAPTLAQKRTCPLTHSGLFCLDDPSDRFLHQPNLPEEVTSTYVRAALACSPGLAVIGRLSTSRPAQGLRVCQGRGRCPEAQLPTSKALSPRAVARENGG